MDNRPIRSNMSRSPIDEVLAWAVALLLSISLVMVYSASIAYADADPATHNQYFYLIRHVIFMTIGLLAAVAMFLVPTKTWDKYSSKIFIVAIILLILVLIPGIGRVVNGSRRWIGLFVLNLQPSEVMKFAIILYAAGYTVRKGIKLQSFQEGFVPILCALSLVAFLLLREPDFGALMVVTCITIGILFLAGLNIRIFLGLSSLILVAMAALIIFSPYRLRRVTGFMDPWKDAYGSGYQLSHSLIAIGRGDWFGVGLGASIEKRFYLPEAHTDFIMAVIAEEFGFLGMLVIIALFATIVLRAFRIGIEAKYRQYHFGALVAQGIGIWLGVQAFFNIGVNLGVLPTKGLTLPLLSFGGSAMLMNLIAVGVLFRIDWENRRLRSGYKV